MKPQITVCFLLLLLGLYASAAAPDQDATLPLGHTKTISFVGPQSSEDAEVNPFTDYRLIVTFQHADTRQAVRGFYAADGDAAQSGASSGDIWKVRFAPDRIGTWTYSAELRRGDSLAIDERPDAGEIIELQNPTGVFEVAERLEVADGRDFRNRGRLVVDDGYFRVAPNGPYFLKGGANSPENLLAYEDFDGTFRLRGKTRDGEAAPPTVLHRYQPHVADWQTGDPTWRGGKGKGLIGAINYLSSTGMNAIYFLTLNIGGDGQDVWPYCDPNDFTRFDCSKLDQWEIVFEHMQRRGVMLHLVTQETENERLLDDGDVGRLRKLYYLELIARFAHHPALVWNLGEENGPADFSPDGQSAIQQKAMADYIRGHDPYGHPIQIHTHAAARVKDELLPPLLGHPTLDGISLQVSPREQVHDQVNQWRRASSENGRRWLITMDEIGRWDTGAVTDREDPDHDVLRHQVLWGSLMAGSGGVEWYFGAKHPHNDLNSEDWRQRDRLWKQTRHAIDFFQEHLPYWQMESADDLTKSNNDFVFAKPGETYLIYHPPADPDDGQPILDLTSASNSFRVGWFNPIEGGDLMNGSVRIVQGGKWVDLGMPPTDKRHEWLIFVTATDE